LDKVGKEKTTEVWLEVGLHCCGWRSIEGPEPWQERRSPVPVPAFQGCILGRYMLIIIKIELQHRSQSKKKFKLFAFEVILKECVTRFLKD
jgi:hypothetical protein